MKKLRAILFAILPFCLFGCQTADISITDIVSALFPLILQSGGESANQATGSTAAGSLFSLNMEINPLYILEDDSSVYLSMDAQKYSSLFNSVLSRIASNLSESDMTSLVGQMGTAYAGIGSEDDAGRLQAVVETSLTSMLLGTMLTEANGWESGTYDIGGVLKLPTYKNTTTGYELSFVPVSTSDAVLCISKDVDTLLENYISLIRGQEKAPAWEDWLEQDPGDLCFYITRPVRYLASLIGQDTDFGAEALYGGIERSTDSSDDAVYSLSFSVRLNETRSATVLRSVLTLSSLLTGMEVEQSDDYTLSLSEIEISESRILSLFLPDNSVSRFRPAYGKDTKDTI